MTYSLEDIEKAWKVYSSERVLRVLRDGKWHTETVESSRAGRINGVSAAVKKICDVMDFPEYLRDMWKK